ncbi:MAG TPA: ATP-binding protein [Noviherbaspirillum sp.]|nr:ATP-binding protein [Noviherbaspirillum sp.]
MIRSIATSVRRRLIAVILLTTAITLALTAGSVLLVETYIYERARVTELTGQAELLGLVSAAALRFDDRDAAAENLAMLHVRPRIMAAAIYDENGRLYAAYVNPRHQGGVIPPQAGAPGHAVQASEIALFQPIVEQGERLGTIYLHAQFGLAERVAVYAAVLAAALAGGMAIAWLLASRLQRSFTHPIYAITAAAKRVIATRDFSRRVTRSSNDEIGVLVDAFNDMLHEVGLRTRALEEANRALAQEMEVRRGAEERLRQADRRKDEFLAMLAHELRNPLAPISAAAQLLRLGRLDEERTRQTSELIARQVDHMTSLVNDLLDVSRVTRGLIILDRKQQDLRRIASDAVDQVRPLLDMRGHRLHVALPDTPALVHGDDKRLVQVLANLLNNAAKYTPTGGDIRLNVALLDEEVELSVIDNGIGMDPELQSHVFELFTQAERTSDRSQGGLGLGLALVKSIVELHGGRVAAYSEGDGKGSAFSVRLPRSVSVAAPAAQPEQQAWRAAGGQARVLVVDDNHDAADSLAAFLLAAGYDVHVSYDPFDAIERARVLVPQVCLLDIGLPGMDGHALARRLRTLPGMADGLLIAVSGYGQPQDREAALAAGFDRHLVKPVDVPALARLLAERSPVAS